MATRRPSRSTSKVDASDLFDFEHKLFLAAALVEDLAEDWETQWGQEWVDQMLTRVPTGPGVDGIHLKNEIRQEVPGGISMGVAYWWWFLEHGTVKMAPQPFVNPAMKKMRTPARKDAGNKAIDLIQRGRIRAAA